VTELPELPAGYFFRLKRWTYGGSNYTIRVSLRKKTWWGSYQVADSLAEHNEESIQQGARFALNESRRKIASRLTIHDRKKFLGDYPPKKLGDFEGRLR
jgi:hypothetical protein